MQGAKTSKFLIQCGRRVHLHKSASFKTSLEQIQTSYNPEPGFERFLIEKKIFQAGPLFHM